MVPYSPVNIRQNKVHWNWERHYPWKDQTAPSPSHPIFAFIFEQVDPFPTTTLHPLRWGTKSCIWCHSGEGHIFPPFAAIPTTASSKVEILTIHTSDGAYDCIFTMIHGQNSLWNTGKPLLFKGKIQLLKMQSYMVTGHFICMLKSSPFCVLL